METTSLSTWHLGHLHSRAVSSHIQNNSISVSPSGSGTFTCEHCFVSKFHKLSHPSSHVPYDLLDLVFFDTWGPLPIQSVDGYRYYVNMVDVVLSFNWPYLMKPKSDIVGIFYQFKTLVENQMNRTIKSVQSDNAQE